MLGYGGRRPRNLQQHGDVPSQPVPMCCDHTPAPDLTGFLRQHVIALAACARCLARGMADTRKVAVRPLARHGGITCKCMACQPNKAHDCYPLSLRQGSQSSAVRNSEQFGVCSCLR
jgi:hypothetical protein